jgi:3-oxoacyl-[acyl-carrier protein] reductase
MNKTLVITGASRGIGFATAQLFAENGYKVVNLSRHPISLEHATQVTVDLNDINWAQIHGETLRALLQDVEAITLVHNAAFMAKDNVTNIKADELQQILQLNVIASTQLNQLALPLMKPGSSILYIGSTLSEKAVANTCSYVVSKHAQLGLMKATCQDLMGRGIHTACVCPGFTDTQMLRQHIGNDRQVLDHFANQTSFQRLLMPREIAKTVLFCAENASINGSVIHANLGQKEY